jgi:anti-anti-sigma factor
VSLEIAIREAGEVTIVDLRGRSTISDGESELLNGYLQKLIASGVRKLLLNLVNLTQVDSSGLSVMVTTYASLRGKGGEFVFLCPRGRVLEALKVLHLLEIIPSFDDEAQALAIFEPRGAFGER